MFVCLFVYLFVYSSLFYCLNSLASIDDFYSKYHVIYGESFSISFTLLFPFLQSVCNPITVNHSPQHSPKLPVLLTVCHTYIWHNRAQNNILTTDCHAFYCWKCCQLFFIPIINVVHDYSKRSAINLKFSELYFDPYNPCLSTVTVLCMTKCAGIDPVLNGLTTVLRLRNFNAAQIGYVYRLVQSTHI